jgi:hypothetical protein
MAWHMGNDFPAQGGGACSGIFFRPPMSVHI